MYNTPLPSIEVVNVWNPKDVVIFLESKKDVLRRFRERDLYVISRLSVKVITFGYISVIKDALIEDLPYSDSINARIKFLSSMFGSREDFTS